MSKQALQEEIEALKIDRDLLQDRVDDLTAAKEHFRNWAEVGQAIAWIMGIAACLAIIYGLVTFVIMLYDTNKAVHSGQHVTVELCQEQKIEGSKTIATYHVCGIGGYGGGQ